MSKQRKLAHSAQRLPTTNSNQTTNRNVHQTSLTYDDSSVDFRQTQQQCQLQRPKEASKQMLYGIFGNVISILEEFEQREMAKMERDKKLPKSNIIIPDQSRKKSSDVESIVNTQLLLFETQTKVCPPDVLLEMKDELKRRTIGWAAVREEIGVKDTKTDIYITKLYEILSLGRTRQIIPDSSGVSEKVMRDSFQKIMKGGHDRKEMDNAFQRNPTLRATPPDTRVSELYHEGAKRIGRARGRNDLNDDLYRSASKHQKTLK